MDSKECTEKLNKSNVQKNGDLLNENSGLLGGNSKTKLENRKFRKYSKKWPVVCILLIFFASSFVVYTLWLTNWYHATIYQKMALRNNSFALKWFTRVPVVAQLTVRIFNYTNTKEFLVGNDKKLKIQEVGPFVYHETLERIIHKYEKDKITYQEFRTPEFIEAESGNREDEQIIVPNVFLIASYQSAKKVFGGRVLVKIAQHVTGSELFKKLSIKEFLWGYRDNLMEKLFQNESFGVIKFRKDYNPGYLTVNTGESNIENLLQLEGFDHKPSLDYWKSEKCNSLKGSTDGSLFPIHWLQRKQNAKILIKYFCRVFPLDYHSEETILGNIPVHRYKPPKNMYSPSKLNPENKCYELNEKYVIEGIFQDNPCAQNALMVVSYPHFYMGDPKLLEPFEGLNPNEQNHDIFADYHSQLGMLVGGHSRFQVSFLIEANSLDPGIKNDIILPILWVQESFGEFPGFYTFFLRGFSFLMTKFFTILQYLSLVIASVSYIILLVLICRK